MELVTQLQILDTAVCVSCCTNCPWERYESIYFPPNKMRFFNLGKTNNLEVRLNSNHFIIDFVPHLIPSGGVSKYRHC